MKRLILFLLLFPILSPLAKAATNLGSGEWFLDQDPGRGAGTAFTVAAAPTATANVTVPAVTLNSLAPGFHLLGVRMRDSENEWSHVVWRGFHKEAPKPPGPSLLAGGEWFIDSDPGTGLGTAIVLPATASATVMPQVPIPVLTPLADGFHLVGVRTRDNLDRWGPVVWRGFHIDRTPATPPDIVSLEYAILRDGAVVSTTTLPASPGGAYVSWNVAHGKTDLLLEAPHLLEITPIGATGQRGHASHGTFTYKTYASAWREQHFTTSELENAAVSGDAADPDEDGLSNEVERFFALNPRNSGDSALAAAAFGKADAAPGWTSEFRVPAGGTVGADGIYRTSNLKYTLRCTSDLNLWSRIPADRITGWFLTAIGDGAATLRLTVSPESTGRGFFRLEGASD